MKTSQKQKLDKNDSLVWRVSAETLKQSLFIIPNPFPSDIKPFAVTFVCGCSFVMYEGNAENNPFVYKRSRDHFSPN